MLKECLKTKCPVFSKEKKSCKAFQDLDTITISGSVSKSITECFLSDSPKVILLSLIKGCEFMVELKDKKVGWNKLLKS